MISFRSSAETDCRHGPGAAINICENIIVGSRLFPDREALIFDQQRLTYGDLERFSAHAAGKLREAGVSAGDRVGLVIPNVPAFVIWYYACLRLGAIAVSVSTRLRGEETAFILSDCAARVLVGTDELVDSLVDHLPDCVETTLRVSDDGLQVENVSLESCTPTDPGSFQDREPDDPATILYTSGTTGFPKGATLSHRNVRATVHAFNHLCGMQAEDRLLLSVPLFHCYGQNALLNSALNVGATLVLQRRFGLVQSKQLIRDHALTMLFGVPTTFQLMVDSCDQDDLKTIRYCFSAAAKLPEQLSRRWHERFGMPIYEGYGLTETAPFASYNHRLQFVPGSIGTPVDLVEMKVVDPDTGETCPPRTPGEIAIRGPNVMLGYWNRPEETAAAVRDGWFFSGDIGETDERGYFYIVDRLKDMIVVGGLKVFPAEVERVLLDHPRLAEAAVVGMPDPVLGERVVAFVVPVSSPTDAASDDVTSSDVATRGAASDAGLEAEVRAHCQLHLGSYKVPARIVVVADLPRNPAGKVLKTKLREVELPKLAAIPPADVPSAAATGQWIAQLNKTHVASRLRFLVELLQKELADLTGRPSPEADASIMDDDMDSLTIVEFRDRLQSRIGGLVELPATIVFDHPKLADLAAHILESLRLDAGGHSQTSQTPDTFGSMLASQTEIKSATETSDREDAAGSIDQMSEQQAMEALLREVND